MSFDEVSYHHIGLVNVTLRAELGRCLMRIRDVERLAAGSIVTLDRLAGEPVELRCRGRCIATGEVVIQDDAFAVRVTDIVDRRRNLMLDSARPARHRKK